MINLKNKVERTFQFTKYAMLNENSEGIEESLKLLTFRLCHISYSICGAGDSPMVLDYCKRLRKYGMRKGKRNRCESDSGIEVMVIHPKFEANKSLFYV